MTEDRGMDSADGPIDTTLRDGTQVRVRPVEPDDKARLVAGMERLSPRSRYLRFHTGIERLSDAQLRYLTEVDFDHHVAWVAVDLGERAHPGIGVARYVRLDDPSVAEAAVTVLDEYQGRGLGTMLLEMLAASATAGGVTTFRSYVLGENQAMLALFDRLGATRVALEPTVWQVDLSVRQINEESSSSVATEVFRAVTGKQLPPMRTTAPPVWTERDHDGDGERPLLREWLDRVLPDGSRPRT